MNRPFSVSSVNVREAELFYTIVEFRTNEELVPVGLILYSPSESRAYTYFVEPEARLDNSECEMARLFAADLEAKMREPDALRTIEYFEDTLSNAVVLGKRRRVPDALRSDPSRALQQLAIEGLSAPVSVVHVNATGRSPS